MKTLITILTLFLIASCNRNIAKPDYLLYRKEGGIVDTYRIQQIYINRDSLSLISNGRFDVSVTTPVLWSRVSLISKEDTGKKMYGLIEKGKDYKDTIGNYKDGDTVWISYPLKNRK